MTAYNTDLKSAKYNSLILAAAIAFTGAMTPVAVATGGLAGHFLLGDDKSWATLPVMGFNIGMAVGALVAAMTMRKLGRKLGFMSGALWGMLGCLSTTLALLYGFFALCVLGLIFIGIGMGFSNQYRFAAADASPKIFKAQAISWVAMGGMFAAIIGPQTAIALREFFDPIPFAGSFAGIIPILLIGMVILSALKIKDDSPDAPDLSEGEARPLKQIVTQPKFMVGLMSGTVTFAMMTFMMTGAPIAMMLCGFSPDQSTLGIQWHVLAMYGPSFFTGKLIDRFGADKITGTGLLVTIISAAIAFSGIELWNFWLSLILLGIGWNFGFIGATAIVSTCYRPSEKNKVQGFHDGVLFTCVALSSLASGQVLNAGGWQVLTGILWPVCGLCFVVLAIHAIKERRGLART